MKRCPSEDLFDGNWTDGGIAGAEMPSAARTDACVDSIWMLEGQKIEVQIIINRHFCNKATTALSCIFIPLTHIPNAVVSLMHSHNRV